MCVCGGGGEGESEETNTVPTLQEISLELCLLTVCYL